MMRVRWTANAANDLASIVSYIRKDNPDAARRVAKTIFGGNPEEIRKSGEIPGKSPGKSGEIREGNRGGKSGTTTPSSNLLRLCAS